MRIHLYVIFLITLLLTSSSALASEASTSFFVSNNTKQIDLQTAFQRLTSTDQQNLQNSVIDVMQKNHIEQGRYENLLGTYRMNSDQHITADNSERFDTSPLQSLSDEKTLLLAKELAIELNQESVAVMIPDRSTTAGISVNFVSAKPTIDETINMIREKLPATYSQAFSIHLATCKTPFNETIVDKIEWLGSQINAEDVQNAFPLEETTMVYGKVYLVYQNGQTEQL